MLWLDAWMLWVIFHLLCLARRHWNSMGKLLPVLEEGGPRPRIGSVLSELSPS